MPDNSEERDALVNQALSQADALVTQVIKGEPNTHRGALELARTLHDLKRKHGLPKGPAR